MAKIIFCMLLGCYANASIGQSAKTNLYDVVKQFLYDSTGYENVGDWAVGRPKKFPVSWKEDKITMSPDTSINFFRMGTIDMNVNGKVFRQNGQPVKWSIMLKGPRMGYTSYSILSSPSNEIRPKYTIDSLFGKQPFKAKLLKACDAKDLAGFYYYEVRLPKKDVAYMKVSWLSLNGNTALRIDSYDAYSKYAARLNCPN